MKDTLYPEIGEFVGSKGKVLSVGYEKINSRVRHFANISSENWYISKESEVSVPSDQGVFLLGDLPTLAKTKSHFFKAIVDYGVLGFTPSRWPEGAVEAHIRSYETLLEKDGRLFLKWDMFWPKENPQEWDKIHRQLLESMIPHSAYLQADHRCPPHFKALLISKLHKVMWHDQAIISFNWTGYKNPCEGYLHSVWIPKQDKS
jgi:hypothetical protein